MAYFVRQRDMFQQESDDLLHNILPDEIATRLKADQSMIADNFEAASVMFADVAGFTPMSEKMSPPELALRIQEHCSQQQFNGYDLRLRIGINSGPVVAGIVGTHKFAYDLWGAVVNTASRMESHGVPESIQISSATYDLIRDDYVCERRGTIEVKGMGDAETYFLLARRNGEPNDVLPAVAVEAAADLD